MRILVTGVAGFIGSNFLRLIENGTLGGISSVIGLDNLTYAGVPENLVEPKNNLNFEFVVGNICDKKIVLSLLSNVDAVINFAAETHVDRSIKTSTDFINTNVVGVQVLLEAIIQSRRSIRFIQISTDEVYGSINSGSWDEKCSLLPNSPYAASKASGELIVRSYFHTHGLDVVTTRSSNNYGPYCFPEKLIPLFITNLLEDKKVPLYGDGKNIRDWLHVSDHCRGIFAALMNGKPGEIYNIGGGSELSNLELTRLIIAEMGKDESSIEYVHDRKGHDFRYSLNWNKIKNDLGYEPEVAFDFGLRETIQWYVENRDWWEPLKKRAEV
jgi:dTDP-glucose 4,6-dehydratase